MTTWRSDTQPEYPRIGARGWLLVVLRGGALWVVVFGGLAVLLLLRLIEAPIFGAHRPWTPFITQGVCRAAFGILGLRLRVRGTPARQAVAMVANHASWLDIFALNAGARIYFVSKADVARWPGIGWLARATGTVFITRQVRDAATQRAQLQGRLHAGHRLLFFPEGTSTDGARVLSFKSSLFAAFFEFSERALIQPVAVRYRAPAGQDARFYGWWGDMEFGPHLLTVLAAPRQGSVEVSYLEPLPAGGFPDRKALAAAAEHAVRSGFDTMA